MSEKKYLIHVVIFSAVVLLSAIILSSTWRANASSNQNLTVTGSAVKDIVSDLGVLRGSIVAYAPTAVEAFRILNRQRPILMKYLEANGFPAGEVNQFAITSTAAFRLSETGIPTNIIDGYYYNQRFEIRSKDVNLIQKISLDISSLIEEGVNFYVEAPEYYYTNLADVKIAIQAEAAKDALTRAEKIVEATGRKLGDLISARMGVLQITPKNSNLISDFGINDVSSIEKQITGVVSASFTIKWWVKDGNMFLVFCSMFSRRERK